MLWRNLFIASLGGAALVAGIITLNYSSIQASFGSVFSRLNCIVLFVLWCGGTIILYGALGAWRKAGSDEPSKG